jgi:hypothetical protein
VTRTTRMLGWAGWLVAILAGVGGVVIRVVDPAPILDNTFGVGDVGIIVFAQLGIVWATVGAVLVDRRPKNLVGALALTTGIGYALSALAPAIMFSAAARPGTVAESVAAWAAWSTGLGTMVTALGFLMALVFPTGHAQSPAWARVLKAMLVLAVVWSSLILTQPGPLHLVPSFPNPVGVGLDFRPWLGPRSSVMLVVMACVLGLPVVVLSVVSRYRAASHVERLQLRWFGWSVGLSLGALILIAAGAALGSRELGEVPIVVFGLTTTTIPLAIAIAIHRIISRTISYGLITGLLVGFYATAILVLQGPLQAFTGGEAIGVALSTLVAAALFQPLRTRVQRAVDRRFHRARFDAERMSASFAARLRDDLDIQSVAEDLRKTTSVAVAPSSLGIWIRGTVTIPGRESRRVDPA